MIVRMLLTEAVRLTSVRNTFQPSAFRSNSSVASSVVSPGARVLSTRSTILPK